MAPTPVIQRKIRKFGIIRFSRASGTHDATTRARMGAMLDCLIDEDEGYIVSALHRGYITIPEAFNAYKKDGVQGIRRLFFNTPLTIESFTAFADEHEWAEGTRQDHFYNFRVLLRFSKKGERLSDLPHVLTRYRATVVKRITATNKAEHTGQRLFNYVRRTALQWIGATQGKTSETYQEAMRVKPFKKNKRNRRVYLSPADVEAIISRMPAPVAAMYWTMATTGAGPKEYLKDGVSVTTGGIHINGKKTGNRDRIVPLAYEPAQPCRKYRALLNHIDKATAETKFAGKVKPYDFRRDGGPI